MLCFFQKKAPALINAPLCTHVRQPYCKGVLLWVVPLGSTAHLAKCLSSPLDALNYRITCCQSIACLKTGLTPLMFISCISQHATLYILALIT